MSCPYIMIDHEERAFGEEGEKNNFSNIQKLCPTFTKTKSVWDPFDFVDETGKIYAELKTRRNTRTKYLTTMIPESKIKKIVDGNTYYFCFNFTDGLYYIKYEKEIFDSFEIKQGGRYDRGRPEIESYVYIPVELLQAI